MVLTRWRHAFLALLILNAPALVSAAVLATEPLADEQANFILELGPVVVLGTLVDGNSNILVEDNTVDNEHSGGLFEFDISELDSSKTVLSASIQLDVNLWTGAAEPEARAVVYDAVDGSITPADFDAGVAATELAGLQQVSLGATVIALDPALVQAIVATDADYLGVMLFITEFNSNYRYGTLESTIDEPALLTITYVPEPESWVLLSAGLVTIGHLCLRRRAPVQAA